MGRIFVSEIWEAYFREGLLSEFYGIPILPRPRRSTRLSVCFLKKTRLFTLIVSLVSEDDLREAETYFAHYLESCFLYKLYYRREIVGTVSNRPAIKDVPSMEVKLVFPCVWLGKFLKWIVMT